MNVLQMLIDFLSFDTDLIKDQFQFVNKERWQI